MSRPTLRLACGLQPVDRALHACSQLHRLTDRRSHLCEVALRRKKIGPGRACGLQPGVHAACSQDEGTCGGEACGGETRPCMTYMKWSTCRACGWQPGDVPCMRLAARCSLLDHCSFACCYGISGAAGHPASPWLGAAAVRCGAGAPPLRLLPGVASVAIVIWRVREQQQRATAASNSSGNSSEQQQQATAASNSSEQQKRHQLHEQPYRAQTPAASQIRLAASTASRAPRPS